MVLTLIYGFWFGDFFQEGNILLGIAWGIVSLIDVYVGFLIMVFWVIYRENTLMAKILWSIGFLILGNVLVLLYIIKNVFESNGDMKIFFGGNKLK
jgi:hypothetical protein